MKHQNLAILFVVGIAIGGCDSNGRSEAEWEEKRAAWAAEVASYPPETYTRAGLRERYSGATILDYSVQHGTQIEYLAPNGKAYLWYPGNSQIVVGDWKTSAPFDGATNAYANICYRYGANTFNPATRQQGGSFHCVPGNRQVLAEQEYTKGDPFNLASMQLPYVLEGDSWLTFEEIGEPLGITIQLYH